MDSSEQLISILEKIRPQLEAISESEAKATPAPGKWSKAQILGHLVDSAINNIGRFIRSQKTQDMLFDGYDQEFWVDAQNYQDEDWKDVINLFVSINMRIAKVTAKIPSDIMTMPRENHSISWHLYADKKNEDPFTLEFLVWDYIAHVENHLKQIITDYQPIVLKV
ncbi:MAG: DinB family protein [Cyclobacteriaceae bacterium]